MTDFLTTTQVAKRLSVSPDTVLKWVKAGKIESRRTLGGHYRIPVTTVNQLESEASAASKDKSAAQRRTSFQYCWEFNAGQSGAAPDECRSCIVYRTRARRCYELRDLPEEFGSLGLYCEGSCESCDFYHLMCEKELNVLLIGPSPRMVDDWNESSRIEGVKVQHAASEYQCGMLVEKFRPDFVVIDCSVGSKATNSIVEHLSEDARIPFVRVILASKTRKSRDFCDRDIFGWIKKPFSLEQLKECLTGTGALTSENI